VVLGAIFSFFVGGGTASFFAVVAAAAAAVVVLRSCGGRCLLRMVVVMLYCFSSSSRDRDGVGPVSEKVPFFGVSILIGLLGACLFKQCLVGYHCKEWYRFTSFS